MALATCDRRPVALNVPAARAGAVGAAHRHHGPSGLQRLLGDAHLLRQPDALSTGGRLRPEVNGAVIAAVRQEEQALGGAGRLLPHHLGAQNLLARAMQRGGRAKREEHALPAERPSPQNGTHRLGMVPKQRRSYLERLHSALPTRLCIPAQDHTDCGRSGVHVELRGTKRADRFVVPALLVPGAFFRVLDMLCGRRSSVIQDMRVYDSTSRAYIVFKVTLAERLRRWT